MYQSIETTSSKKTSRTFLCRMLTSCVAVFIVAYIGFMIKTVSLINERKEIRESIRQTQITISDLEVQYFNLAQSIDTQTIQQLGFTESTVPVFAYTEPTAPTVALR